MGQHLPSPGNIAQEFDFHVVGGLMVHSRCFGCEIRELLTFLVALLCALCTDLYRIGT